MGKITELRLRDIRCFDGEQSGQLSRITLLVGDNSSGKSTFLGCYNAFATLANLHDLDNKNIFDEEPFNMGSFSTIVRSGKSEFAVGGSFENHCHTSADFAFRESDKGDLLEREIKLEFDNAENSRCKFNASLSNDPEKLKIKGPKFRFNLRKSEISHEFFSTWLSRYVRRGFLPYRGEPTDFRKRHDLNSTDEEVTEFTKFISFLRTELPLLEKPAFRVNALDPALPPRKRVYESLPPYLASADALKTYRESIWKTLGLWKSIWVKHSSYERGFEIMVETESGSWNLVDVGYGVHNLLPLVQFIQNAEPMSVFLLQQPEIHVHPAVQAQLAQLMAESNFGFIIETHSDHLIDRFRICVMDEVLKPEDLTILYFETDSHRTKSNIHTIALDNQANFINVPEGYRKFFMEETKRSMGL